MQTRRNFLVNTGKVILATGFGTYTRPASAQETAELTSAEMAEKLIQRLKQQTHSPFSYKEGKLTYSIHPIDSGSDILILIGKNKKTGFMQGTKYEITLTDSSKNRLGTIDAITINFKDNTNRGEPLEYNQGFVAPFTEDMQKRLPQIYEDGLYQSLYGQFPKAAEKSHYDAMKDFFREVESCAFKSAPLLKEFLEKPGHIKKIISLPGKAIEKTGEVVEDGMGMARQAVVGVIRAF